MDITVFGNYKVEFKGEYSYLNEDGDFSRDSYCETKIKSGGELIEIIARELKNNELIQFTIKDNVIYLNDFNPQTGEGSDAWITILEEVKE